MLVYNGTNPSTANAQTVSQYDASDNVAGISDPSGLNTVYDHNGLGDLTGIHSPDTGTTLFTVDAAGNRITKTDARGIVTTYAYDALNRVTSATYGDTSLNVAYFYDEANTVTGCVTSAPTCHLTRVVEDGVTTSYCYDARGNVTDKRQTQGTVTDTIHYVYTLANRVQSETRPGGAVVAYTRNSLGQVTGVVVTPASGAAQTVVSNITWLPFGPMQAYTLGNGQTVTRTYDSNYRVTDIVSPALELHFSLDEMGNITGVSESGGGTASYLYDPLYRLTSVRNAAGSAVETYTYNLTGDRLSKAAPGAYTGTYKYKAGTHWLTDMGTASRTYDANGNTTGSSAAATVWGYGYNGRNRMTAVTQNGTTVGTYVYNAFGERVSKRLSATTTRFVYDEASQLVSEVLGTTRRDYIAVAGIPLAVADGSSLGFITADGLGSPRTVTSSTGAVVWNWPYATNPFGENRPVSSTGYLLNLRLPGQYADGEAGLKYNLNRSFDAATGRYLESDPVGLAAGPSTYGYVEGNPLGHIDPLGLDDSQCMLNPAWCGQVHQVNKPFVFGSIEGETKGLVRFGAEGVALAGYNPEDGWSAGVIGAGLTAVGTDENYVAGAVGVEKMLGEESTAIRLYEFNVGLPVLGPWGGLSVGGGYYETKSECGAYIHVSGNIVGEHAALGIGTLPPGGKALTVETAISRIVGPRLGLSEPQLANLESMIRNSGRRKVGRGALRNVIVRLQSEKNHDSRVVESHTAEHVFALTLELDPDVIAYFCQVPCARVARTTSAGRKHVSNANVDFLVIRATSVELVECKKESFIDDMSANPDGWECIEGAWTYHPYAQFAKANGISFRVWISPRHVGIYLRNLEACYAALRTADNSQLSQTEEQIKRLLTRNGITGRDLHRQVPSFDARVLLRLIAVRCAFVALKTADLDDYENVTIYSIPEGAEREDLLKSSSFAEHVGALAITNPFLIASQADRLAAERRIKTLADIEAGKRQDTSWMRGLRRRVVEGERNGIPAVVTCLTNYARSGNRRPRATIVQKEIGKYIVESEWNTGKAARPIDLFRRYRQECAARGVDALSRTAFDRLRKTSATTRRVLNTGGMRAYQAERSATDPLARSLSSMGFGHTVHIDSSKFDNRVAPSVLLGLPAECATFYLAVDEATGMPIGCKLIFGAARIQGIALLMRDIVRRHGFLPRMIHCDRGPENRSRWLEDFCHLRTGIRYSPTAGSAWNGLAENTIKQVNDQVAHRLAGSTLPDRRGRAVDGRFKSYRNAKTDFLTIVEEVEHFVFHVLPKVPDRKNLTPEEKRDYAMDRYGCMGVPTEYNDDFLIQTSSTVKLGRRLDSRRGLRTDLGYYVSDELIYAISRAKVEEARRDCNYPEVMYVRTDAGEWIKAFHSSIAQCGGNSTLPGSIPRDSSGNC